MRVLTLLALTTALVACNTEGAPDDPTQATVLRLAADRVCPLPVPERDTLLASAILAGDATPVDAFLEARPTDPTAQAVKAVIAGALVEDPDQMACISPYL